MSYLCSKVITTTHGGTRTHSATYKSAGHAKNPRGTIGHARYKVRNAQSAALHDIFDYCSFHAGQYQSYIFVLMYYACILWSARAFANGVSKTTLICCFLELFNHCRARDLFNSTLVA